MLVAAIMYLVHPLYPAKRTIQMLEIDLELYRTAFYSLLISSILALVFVVHRMRNLDWPGAVIRIFHLYFIIGALGWIRLAFIHSQVRMEDLSGSLLMYFLSTYILCLALIDRARGWKVAGLLGVLHVLLAAFTLSLAEASSRLEVVSVYAIVICLPLAVVEFRRAFHERNFGHAVIGAALTLAVAGGAVQVALLAAHDLPGAFQIALIVSATGYLLLGIGFLVTVLLSKHQQLTKLALRDPLTSLLNRRGLEQALCSMSGLAGRQGKPMSAIAIDIDHFKQINDTYGHDCGDQVLQSLSDALRNTIRDSDVCCRLGGEEFVIVLPLTGLAEAAPLAERLRTTIEGLVVKYCAESVSLTASLGLACQEGPFHLDTLLKDADKMLYAAKSAGRNRVERPNGLHQ